MSCVIGIDQSVLHTGVCVLNTDTGVALLALIEPPKQHSGLERLVYLHTELTKFLRGTLAEVAVLEGYSIDSHNRPFDLGEVGGVVKLVLHAHAKRVHSAAPKQLKKFVTGNGQATKSDVIAAIHSIWGVGIENDNLADAYGLAQIALCIWDSNRAVRRAQLDIIKKMCAPLSAKAKQTIKIARSI